MRFSGPRRSLSTSVSVVAGAGVTLHPPPHARYLTNVEEGGYPFALAARSGGAQNE